MKELFERFVKPRMFLVCYCVLSLLLIVEMVCLFNAYNTFNYKGHRLRVQSVHQDSVVMTDRDGSKLTMTVEIIGESTYIRQYTITYLSETIFYRYEFGENVTYTFSDGYTYSMPFVQVSVNGASPDDSLSGVYKEEKRLTDTLAAYFMDYTRPGVFVGLTLIGLLLLLLAQAQFFYPEVFWGLQTFLSVKGGEPTDFYLLMSKVTGVVAVLAVYIGFAVFGLTVI